MSPKNFFPRPVSRGSLSTLAFMVGGVVLAGIAWVGLTGGREASTGEAEALAAPDAVGQVAPAASGKDPRSDSVDASRSKSIVIRKSGAKSPNVIGVAPGGADEGTVSAGVARKLKKRAQYAERLLAKEKKKTARLEGEVADLRARVGQLMSTKQPPPPTEAEEVLETLRPLLSANRAER